jgi:hypothetical protein
MDNLKEYEEKMTGYNNIITTAKKSCEKADKDLLVAETQLQQHEERKKQLEEQCLAVAGVPIDQLDQIIEQNTTKLDTLTAFISVKFGNGTIATVAESDVEELKNFVDNNGIPTFEEASF